MIDQETLKSVEDLHRLKTEGIITPEEFEQAKARLLFGPKPAAAGPGLASVLRASAGPVAMPADDDLLGWVLLPLRRYADFTGRSGRREFWLFQAALAALGVVAVAVISTIDGGALMAVTIGSLGLVGLGLLVPQIALQVRRFHDQNRSGLFALLNLVPYLGPVVVLVFMLLEGDPRENQYGPDPLAR